MYKTFPKLDNLKDDLDQKIFNAQHHTAEVFDSHNLPVVKDVYKSKQSQLLALIATMPLIAGLIASVVLALNSHDIAKPAYENTDVYSYSVCAEDEVIIHVGVMHRDYPVVARVNDLVHEIEVELVGDKAGSYAFSTLPTGEKFVEQGEVVFTITSPSGKDFEVISQYSDLSCE